MLLFQKQKKNNQNENFTHKIFNGIFVIQISLAIGWIYQWKKNYVQIKQI